MLLSLRNTPQRQDADCLAACAEMVLEYLGIRVDYYRLLRMLGTGEPGTPFFNIDRVVSLGVFVRSGQYRDSVSLLDRIVGLGLPIIVAVNTGYLEHWEGIETDHAVVVVGLDDETVFINDPFFDEAPFEIPALHFLNAWSGRDFQYAIISLTALDP